MNGGRRFSIGGLIDIRKLEHETRKYLYLGFTIAFVVHAIAGVYFFLTLEKRKELPAELKDRIPVKIILRYAPSRYPIYRPGGRRQFAKRPYQPRRLGTASPSRFPAFPGRPFANERAGGIGDIRISEDMYVQPPKEHDYHVFDDIRLKDDGIQRFDDNSIRISDEMIDIEELDTGKFKAVIVTHPDNVHLVRGYIHIPMGVTVGSEKPEITQEALKNLGDYAMKRYTDIEIKLDNELDLGSRDIFKYPFLYITSSVPFELKPHEAKNFREYLEAGGFALVEPTGVPAADNPSSMSKASASMRAMIKETFGHSARLVPLSQDHELFHCFFDIDIEHGYNKFPIKDYGEWWRQPLDSLEGVFVGQRLALVYSEKGYGYGWSADGLDSAYKFGVNCIVYALRQYGGTAVRMVDVSSEAPPSKRLQFETTPAVQPRGAARGTFGQRRSRR